MIVHWPKGIAARGELRRAVGHVIDFVPTLLELAGASPSSALGASSPSGAPGDAGGPPFPGRSLVPFFARDVAVEREFVFFHHEENRALRMGDWKIVSAQEDGDVWELHDLARDRCEMVDRAAERPEQVRRMEARWKELEAEYRRQAGPGDPPPEGAKKGAKKS